ncbi:hypothetical protein CLU79DRAFT_762322 [Phycomyces nitens]|nr:hypothetical protein CLU79DRAFT_762322 [Phycomyces nitens]
MQSSTNARPKTIPTTNSPTISTTSTTSTTTIENAQSIADILKRMNVRSCNLTALHQMTAAITGLVQLSPNLDLTRILSACMQLAAKNAAGPSQAQKSTIEEEPENQKIVYAIKPSSTPMYITVLDNTPVCVAVFEKTDSSPEHRILRRLDSGTVHGTSLLTAGGIETERERSMILSFEMNRIRVANKASALHGTWIPLRRAQELAATCSIQDRLGPFLTDQMFDYFPSPLPIDLPAPRPRRIVGTELSLPNSKKQREPFMPLSASKAAQLHQLMLVPQTVGGSFASKPPVLGSFEGDEDPLPRSCCVVSSSQESTKKKGKKNAQDSQRWDGACEDDTDAEDTDDNDDDDTDTDTDVVEVRARLWRVREAAMNQMDHEIMTIDPKQQKSRLERFLEHVDTANKETFVRPVAAHGRRRPSGGKWSANRPPGTRIVSSAIKKAASWNGALSTGRHPNTSIRKKTSQRKSKDHEKTIHQVVEHAPPTKRDVILPLRTVIEEDEDEEIDIGGSDRDDDLR